MRKSLATASVAFATLAMSIPAHAGLPGFWNERTVRAPRTVVFHYRGENTSAVHISLQWWWMRKGKPTPVHTVTADLEQGARSWSWAHQFSRRRRLYHVTVYAYSVSFWKHLYHRLIVAPIPTPLADCNTFTTGDGETWACWDGCPPPCVGGTNP